MTLPVSAPLAGRVVPMSEVPDPVFAGGMVGGGVAIDPARGTSDVISPVAGKLLKLHPHAFVVLTSAGVGVLVHLGIDTVQLKGEGFTLHVDEGDELVAGQLMVSWNPAEIEAGGRSPICPVVVMDTKQDALTDLAEAGDVAAGDVLFTWPG